MFLGGKVVRHHQCVGVCVRVCSWLVLILAALVHVFHVLIDVLRSVCVCTKYTSHILLCLCLCVVRMQRRDSPLPTVDLFNHTPDFSVSLSLSPPRLSVGDEIHNQIKKTGGKGKIDSSNMRWAKEIDKNDPHLGWIHAMMMLNADDMDTVYLFHPFAFDCSQSLSISYIITHTKAPPLR